jgi:hypothetical protein
MAIAKSENWSECTILEKEGEDKFTVTWVDKVHGREPYKRTFCNLPAAVRRYNDFMNTEASKLNLDGTRKGLSF